MFAYCNNIPIAAIDMDGNICVDVGIEHGTNKRKTHKYVPGTVNESLKKKTRIEDVQDDILPTSYNCYGFAIGKVLFDNPSGYTRGDTARDVFEAVQKDLGGSANCRELDGIDIPCAPGWYKVAVRCSDTDYHFIRQIRGTLYSKSGQDNIYMVSPDYVSGDRWGITRYDFDSFGADPPYTGEIIFFEIREGWDMP